MAKHNKVIDRKHDVKGDQAANMIYRIMDQAGIAGRPSGMECVGYAVVFMYANKYSRDGEFRSYSNLKMVQEQSASDAVAELAKHMKQKYGRKLSLEG